MTNTILITGASSGIGRAAARRFHCAGWNIVATMRSPQREQELNTLEHVLVTRLDVFAVEGLSEALHFELLPLGVRVKIVEPGMVKTNFAGRSFDFNNDSALNEYQPLVQGLLSALGPMAENASPPELIAETIFGAANDGADRLRYEAGIDAEHLLASRRAANDATFLGGIRSQFGL